MKLYPNEIALLDFFDQSGMDYRSAVECMSTIMLVIFLGHNADTDDTKEYFQDLLIQYTKMLQEYRKQEAS